MEPSELDNFIDLLRDNHTFISGLVSRMKKRGNSLSIELSEAEQDRLTNIIRNIPEIAAEFESAKKAREERSRIVGFRASIWEAAGHSYKSGIELMEKLFALTGPVFNIDYISYYMFREGGGSTMELQWSKHGIERGNSIFVSNALTDYFCNSEHVSLRSGALPDDIPDKIKSEIEALFASAQIHAYLAAYYPDMKSPQGFISFSITSKEREWNKYEIAALVELVRIVSLKSTHIEAENSIRLKKEELETRVREKTSQLETDIEARKNTERALRDSEDLYRTLVRTCPDSIIVTDTDLNIIMVNDAALALNGLDDDSVILGRNAVEFLHPQDFERARENAKILGENGTMITTEYLALKHDGTSYPGEFSISVIMDENGNPKAFLAVIRDLTKRKMIEDALEKEKELFEVALRSINEGVITTGTIGKVLFMNRMAEQLTGWKQRESTGRDIELVFRIFDERTLAPLAKNIVAAVAAGEIIDLEENRLLESKGGSKIRIAGTGAPIRDRHGKTIGCVFVFRDITEKKLLEADLLKSRNLESIGTLAGGIAHDFNNILTAIVTNITLARMYAGQTSPDAVEHLINAEKAVTRATKLTGHLLTFARGGLPVKESASLREIIEDSLQFTLSGSNISWSVNIPDVLWQVEVDREQIYQVINNIVFNAKESMPDGGTVECSARNIRIDSKDSRTGGHETVLENGDYVMVTIRDEGCGIPAEFLEKIFDPYFTTKLQGTGLGLTGVYSVIKKHGGYIRVDSAEGKGTTFIFYLPVSATKKPSGIDLSKEQKAKGGSVLIMDDDDDIGNILTKVLEKSGYSTSWVKEGHQAIGKYQKSLATGKPYDVVFMDLTIRGGLGGRETAEEILKIDPKAKMVVSSGYSNDPVMANYKDYGFVGVLIKPFSIETMLDVIGRIVG